MTTTTANQNPSSGANASGAKFAGAKETITQGADKAKAFAKARPAATAALAGVIGLALLNTLRGR